MNIEALFLFLILLLGLVLCSFLGGYYNKEAFTGTFTINPDNTNANTNNSNTGNNNNNAMSYNGSNTSNTYDNYNHYSGSSSQLSSGSTFYGNNGGSVKVNMQTDGTPILSLTLSPGQQPINLTNTSQNNYDSKSNKNSSSSDKTTASSDKTTASSDKTTASKTTSQGYDSDSDSDSVSKRLSAIFGNSSSSQSKSNTENKPFYGPNGETGLVINYNGQQAIQVITGTGSYIFTMNAPVSSNQIASNPFNSNYTSYNNTPSTYFGSTGVNGANVNNSNTAYSTPTTTNSSSTNSQSSQQSQPQASSRYDYSNSLPQGIPKSQIQPGHEDLYILKSEVVPPVCPACPPSTNIPRQEPCPACPPCASCPEPSFECKKVPNYSAINNQYLPVPVLSDFSSFGM
jgi:hypothetical protein